MKNIRFGIASEKIKELFKGHNRNFVSISGDYQERYIKAIYEIDKLLK